MFAIIEIPLTFFELVNPTSVYDKDAHNDVNTMSVISNVEGSTVQKRKDSMYSAETAVTTTSDNDDATATNAAPKTRDFAVNKMSLAEWDRHFNASSSASRSKVMDTPRPAAMPTVAAAVTIKANNESGSSMWRRRLKIGGFGKLAGKA